MSFFTIFDRPAFVPTCPGDEIVPVYEREEGDVGEPWHLVKVGERNIQKAIDSARPPCMSDILLHALRGDTSVISNNTGFFATGDEASSFTELFKVGQQNLLSKIGDIVAASESEVKPNVDPSPAE